MKQLLISLGIVASLGFIILQPSPTIASSVQFSTGNTFLHSSSSFGMRDNSNATIAFWVKMLATNGNGAGDWPAVVLDDATDHFELFCVVGISPGSTTNVPATEINKSGVGQVYASSTANPLKVGQWYFEQCDMNSTLGFVAISINGTQLATSSWTPAAGSAGITNGVNWGQGNAHNCNCDLSDVMVFIGGNPSFKTLYAYAYKQLPFNYSNLAVYTPLWESTPVSFVHAFTPTTTLLTVLMSSGNTTPASSSPPSPFK